MARSRFLRQEHAGWRCWLGCPGKSAFAIPRGLFLGSPGLWSYRQLLSSFTTFLLFILWWVAAKPFPVLRWDRQTRARLSQVEREAQLLYNDQSIALFDNLQQSLACGSQVQLSKAERQITDPILLFSPRFHSALANHLHHLLKTHLFICLCTHANLHHQVRNYQQSYPYF